jgi:hypothetical protein
MSDKEGWLLLLSNKDNDRTAGLEMKHGQPHGSNSRCAMTIDEQYGEVRRPRCMYKRAAILSSKEGR